jgi:aryl-alcohol dehydrogenase-like predicted oxidoreductase
VDTYYIHAPENRVPVKETLSAIDKLYKAGKFKRFGLSQYNAAETEEVIRVAKENGYVLPTVFQSNYSAVARRQEKEVLPLLHKHGIAFYAYSPIAGGFLAKTPEQLAQGGEGRWDPKSFFGQMYHGLYNKPSMIKALGEFGAIAKDAGISQAELAYRWLAFNSALQGDLGDGLVIGPKNKTQLLEIVETIRKGPLSEEIGVRVDALWKDVEKDSPLDNWESYTSHMFK